MNSLTQTIFSRQFHLYFLNDYLFQIVVAKFLISDSLFLPLGQIFEFIIISGSTIFFILLIIIIQAIIQY